MIKIELNKIYNMDNIEGMKQMISEGIQVDSIVCDPPYFLSDENTFLTEDILKKGKVNKKGFMGKEWDGGTVEVIESSDVPKGLLE